jgi:uncharacterized protein
MLTPSRVFLFACLGLCLVPASLVRAQFDHPPRPGPRQFVVDQANVFNASQQADIQRRCDDLLSGTATPILVVTLKNLSDHAPPGTPIEGYARALFNHWGIGLAQLNGKAWNTGVLVLYVKDTGRTRVELGAGWGRTKDQEVKNLLITEMVPRREAGDPSAGLLATVRAMVRKNVSLGAGAEPAARAAQAPRAWESLMLLLMGLTCVALPFVLTGIALARIMRASRLHRGSAGVTGNYTGGFHGGAGGAGGGSFGGGGFGGGSFGGGFSGGGGASV